MGGWRETEVKTVNKNCINYLSDLTAGVAATKLQTSVRTKMVIVTQSRHISSSSSTNTVCVNRRLHNLHFFIARRHVSAAFAVVMCVSVRPSVRRRPVCVETTGRIELVFGMEASFHPSHTVF